jgi:transposase
MSKAEAAALTQRQERAIVALLREPTIQKAADAIGVHEKTIYRWLKEPEFTQVYRGTRREAFSQAVALTQKYAPMAVQSLAKTMLDPTTPAASRVTAASTLLRFGREGLALE